VELEREPGAIEIRPLRTHEEFQACLTLQRETWGDAPGTLVPTPLLLVVQRIGGVSAGAFDANDRLLGFVFGMTGIEHGVPVHWSDMLAVRPEARNRGLGRLLKEYQREQVARLGVRRIYWTYDPLVAKNAYLNIVVLGARVAEYVPDMYGDTGSPVHAGIGTDRIIVAWDLDAAGRHGGSALRAMDVEAERRVELNPSGHAFAPPDAPPARVAIAIPADVFAVRGHSPDEALRWRLSTREAFQWALARGYEVEFVERDPTRERASYSLVRRSTEQAS
jgi:predicted GNAT superfamily acetyltransferase